MLARIANVFWNRNERRLRALWRLLIQMIAWQVGLLILQIVVVLVLVLIALATQTLTIAQLTDTQYMMEFVGSRPALRLVAIFVDFAVTMGAVWLAGLLLDRRRFANFGFHFNKDWWIDLGFGLFLGALLMSLIFMIELAAGWVRITGTFVTNTPGAPFALALLIPLILFITVGIQEEAFSRGYQLTNLAEGLNWKSVGPRWAALIATLLSSLIFGLLHAWNPNASLISTLNLSLAGILLAMGYILTGELAIPIGIHITWNFFQGNVFGFPVSGMDASWATFIAIEQSGPALWTGGAFGPEAGLMDIGATLIGILLIVLWAKLRYGRVGLHTALAEAPTRTQVEQHETTA